MSKRRAVILVGVLLVGFALTVSVYSMVLAESRAQLTAKFATQSEAIVADVSQEILYHTSAVNALAALFSSQGEVPASQFLDFSVRVRAALGGIAVLEWAPRVGATERVQFERWARSNVFDAFRIKDAAGHAISSKLAQADSFPVTFVEPIVGNQSAIGFDLGSNPARLATLLRARDQGGLAITERIKLVQDGKSAVLMALPVFQRGTAPNTPETRRDLLKGFIIGVIRLAELVDAALKRHDMAEAWFWLQDETDATAPALLHSNRAGYPTPFVLGGHSLLGAPPIIETSRPLSVGGRNWALHLAPTELFIARHYSSGVWPVLVVGLLFTGLIGAFTLLVTGREQSLRRLADERTRELTTSERFIKSIASNLPGLVGYWDSTLRCKFANKQYEEWFGKYPEPLLSG